MTSGRENISNGLYPDEGTQKNARKLHGASCLHLIQNSKKSKRDSMS